MNTIYKFPASKLPAELRGGFSDEELVTVTVASDSQTFPILTDEQYDKLFAKSIEQEKHGEGTECKTPQDVESYFANLRSCVDAKYKTS